MQDFSARLDPSERKVVRGWRVGVLAFYGTIIAVLVLLGALADRPTQVAGNTRGPDFVAAGNSPVHAEGRKP